MKRFILLLTLFVFAGFQTEANCYLEKSDFIIARIKYGWITSELFAYIRHYSKKYDIPVLLTCAVIQRESDGKKYERGSSGEYGYMQPLEIHFKKAYPGLSKHDYFEPEYNLDRGCWYLRESLNRSHGDLTEALRRYNQGLYGKRWRYKNWKYTKDIIKDFNDSLKRKERRYASIL